MDREQLKALIERWRQRLPVRQWRDPAPVVSVLQLSGVIGQIGPGGGGMMLSGLERAIDRAFGARHLVAVALAVNSPGGSPVQSALIAGRIRQLAEEKDIPVIAFAEDLAASGGYYISAPAHKIFAGYSLACAADEIFADENSIIGSIGVISAGFGFAAIIDRFGIERRVHKSGARKGMFDPFVEEAPQDIARLHSIQADMHESFKQMVRRRRGDRLNGPDDDLFEGDIWTGRQALALGLIDGIGDVRSVMRTRYGDRVKLRRIATRGSRLRRLLGRRGAGAGVIEALAAVEEWALWRRFGL